MLHPLKNEGFEKTMKQKDLLRFLICAGFLLFSGGCAWYEETGPEPVSPPYTVAVPSGKADTEKPLRNREEHIVNEIASGISLQMALSGKGPYRIVFSGGRCSVLQAKVFHTLRSMGLVRREAEELLYCTEIRKNGSLEFHLGFSPGTNDFYTYRCGNVSKQEKMNP